VGRRFLDKTGACGPPATHFFLRLYAVHLYNARRFTYLG
jgi:hypothetical protein